MSNYGYNTNADTGISGLSYISRQPHHHHHHHGKAGVSGLAGPNYPINPAVNPAMYAPINVPMNVPIGPPPMVSPAYYGPAPVFSPLPVAVISHVPRPCGPVIRPSACSSVGVILVLFILLVIIARTHHAI